MGGTRRRRHRLQVGEGPRLVRTGNPNSMISSAFQGGNGLVVGITSFSRNRDDGRSLGDFGTR